MYATFTGQYVSATAATTDTITSGTLTRNGAIQGLIIAFITYNDTYLTNPITDVSYGGEALVFGGAVVSSVNNVSNEMWYLQNPTTASGTFTAHSGAGSSVSLILTGIELQYIGHQGPTDANATDTGTSNTQSSVVTEGDTSGGRKSTITVPATDALFIACAGQHKGTSLSFLSITAGTELTPQTTAGAAGATVAQAIGYMQMTGGADTISWGSVIAREWATIGFAFVGCTLDGIFGSNNHGAMPSYY